MTALFALAALMPTLSGPDTEAFAPGQSIADEIRAVAGTVAAWVPAGVLKGDASGDLASYLLFPDDDVAVLRLTGKQVKAALERSVSLYPSPNPSFLQVSGLEVTFRAGAAPDGRISAVKIGGTELDEGASYEVAMPSNLAKGGLGFFTVWDRRVAPRPVPNSTLESLLKGKSVGARAPRWRKTD